MKNFFLLIFSLFIVVPISAQKDYQYRGKVIDSKGNPLAKVILLNNSNVTLAETDEKGFFSVENDAIKEGQEVLFFLENYQLESQKFTNKRSFITVTLYPFEYSLSEVVVRKKVEEQHNFRNLRDIEGMTVNSGKKTEVVLLENLTVNKATNNARQIFSKVVGLTINESSDGGLQLNIGGRGLNPNRTANFNTRQNGYDISADVLGYPESYYTPPAEGIREIQIIRGAASLQYGTQFGGMVNFKMKRPSFDKIHLNQRVSLGSYDLFSSFSEVSGTVKNFSYYSYLNYKKGGGYRPNSKFTSYNAFVNLNYRWQGGSSLHLDILKYHYLAKQPGGLTNYMFYENPRQSNRPRNWFLVDWNVVDLLYEHQFNEDLRFSIHSFGLMAERTALGYRSYRVSQADNQNEPRDLLKGKFKNWGAEAKLLKTYRLFNQKNSLLAGVKYYQSNNSSEQGAGDESDKANFKIASKQFPLYERQSHFTYPNLNLAFFAENIFKINAKTSITPGFRIEKIKTQSDGSYRIVATHAGRVLNDTLINDYVTKDRTISLVGIGISHKMKDIELYGNLSQNYRSVTFSDIHSNTPGFAIAPDITDEKGYTSDFGVRGSLWKVLFFDASLYALYYGDKIGEYFHVNKIGAVERYRDNVGNALTYGFEMLYNWDLNKTFINKPDIMLKTYTNVAFTGSSYLSSDVPNIKGNKVEFVPFINLKSGLEFGYKDFLLNAQITYISEQYAEATNQDTPKNENQYGIFGKIPSYYIIDLSASYKFNKYFTLEGSVQNLTNNSYFTQRATGYPGPGIIPSYPINYMLTLSVSL